MLGLDSQPQAGTEAATAAQPPHASTGFLRPQHMKTPLRFSSFLGFCTFNAVFLERFYKGTECVPSVVHLQF